MKPKTLVTGGAGCIGSELAEALVFSGQRVVVLDNLSSGKLARLSPLLERPNFEFVEADLLDSDALDRVLQDVGMVFHLAANPEVKFRRGDPTDRDLRQNVLATYALLEAMRIRGVKKLAFASTSAVYGVSEKFPIAEDAPLPRPISLYGATKLSCEAMISAFQNLFDMQCWIFRFANIVGSKSRRLGRTVISDFIHRLRRNPHRLEILGNGRQAKSYLLSGECVEAMLFVVEHGRQRMSSYNIGCDDWLTVTRIAEIVVEEMGLGEVELSCGTTAGGWPGDVPRFLLDVSAINALGWRAKHNSEEAVRIAVRAMLATCRQ